jgi:hypothetical protein
MNACRCLLTITLGLLLVAGGCARKKPNLDEGENADSPMPVAQFHHGKPLTIEECKSFAARLEAAAKSDKPQEVLALFDWESLFERSLAGINLSKRDRDATLKGMRESDGPSNLTKLILEAVNNGGSYRPLRVHDKDEGKRVLFRLVNAEGGLNYHDLMLARRPDNQARVIDFHVVLSGEAMSTTMRRMFLTVFSQTNKGLFAKLVGREQDLVKHLPTWTKMGEESRAGNHQEVMRLFNTLPPSLQKEKPIQITRILSAAALGDELHQQALDDYEKHFPNDPSLDLIRIDSLILKKKYAEALAAVDRLDKAVGGDPYLDTLRANIHLESGKPEQARQPADRAVKSLPDLQQPYWTMVSISLKEKDHAATVKWLTELDERFDLDLDNLKEVPDYADFIKSPEYKKWAADRKKDK